MTFETILDSNLFKWVILPFLIFLARICDQSIGFPRCHSPRAFILEIGHFPCSQVIR